MTERQLTEEKYPKASVKKHISTDLPMISIIIPVRNEEKYLCRCLDSIDSQTYNHDRIEILIINGLSEDDSEEIATEFMSRTDISVRILQNKAGNTPCGMNVGYRNALGDIFIIFNGHATMSPDFIEKNVFYLEETGADAVGGLVLSTCLEEKTVPKAIGYALNSPFGLGGVTARTGTKAGISNNPSFGAYRRELFDKFGFIDERLTRNQDYEFNQRITSGGAKVYFTPEIHSKYYNRPSYCSLWKEYFKAAKWRTFMIGRFARAIMFRHLVPPAFVIGIIALAALSFVSTWAIYTLLTIVGIYSAVSLASSISIGSKQGFKYIPAVFLSYYVIHIAYGLGFVWGFLWFAILRGGKSIYQAETQ